MSVPIRPFEPGTLLGKVQTSTAQAIQRGALHSIPTHVELMEEGGVNFLIRIVSNLSKKNQAKAEQLRRAKDANTPRNPFLPYDQDLFVADISETYVCLLNKFNVVDHHLLMVTRSFQAQDSLLTHDDFKALLVCLVEFEGLAFYNSGEVSGASQRHRHWQMVPLPLVPELPHLPIEPHLNAARFEGGMGFVPGFHFLHVLTRMNSDWLASPVRGAHALCQQYAKMLERTGLTSRGRDGKSTNPDSYNLLLTREWMLVVPRSTECVKGISVNALAFAGGFLVRDEEQLLLLKTIGPMTALQRVAKPDTSN